MAKPFHSPAPPVNAKTIRAFHGPLVRWFVTHRRDLPWRRTRDPYAIWVSEIMLQQTRVETVIAYYQRWMQALPTVADLAQARPERVLKLWEGLGYYSRARNLQRAAQIVVREGFANLRELPGIGPYTAGAIGSIAFDQRVALVDGNVARVFARVFGITANIKEPATQKQLWALAEALLPARHCGQHNEALMELGALVCLPANPECGACPLAAVCRARARGQQTMLPNRGPAPVRQQVTQDVAWVCRDGRVRLRRRPRQGLLAGMWELPASPSTGRPLVEIKHSIMNQRITLRVFAQPEAAGQWIRLERASQLPMPAAHRRALERLCAPGLSAATAPDRAPGATAG